jgi:hypothetical protein
MGTKMDSGGRRYLGKNWKTFRTTHKNIFCLIHNKTKIQGSHIFNRLVDGLVDDVKEVAQDVIKEISLMFWKYFAYRKKLV